MARFPSDKEREAMQRDAGELWELVRWHYRHRPRLLRKIHKLYAAVCCLLLRALELRTEIPDKDKDRTKKP